MEQNKTQLLLESPKQLADRVGIPVSRIRHLIKEKMIDHLFTAPGQRNPKIPQGAWERYVDANIVKATTAGSIHLNPHGSNLPENKDG